MAKKIRLDFSKVEERSGYNSRQMPEGLYEARVSGLVQKDAQDGTPMLVYTLAPTQTKYATRAFPYYCKLQQNQLWKLRDLFVAAGETIPKKATQIDPEKIINAKVAIEVGDDTGQYADRSVIVSVYPLDTLSDLDDEDEQDDDIEDDDIEDDEDDEEDLEDDFDDLDDDEDEDNFDEDELDDEDLDDEWEDDEEEEEEETPAPKKSTRTKRAAPPAKRTVKRKR